MGCPKYLYDELFPVKIYHNDHYLPHKLTSNEKLYLELYNNADGNIRKVDLIMSDSLSYLGISQIKNHLSALGLVSIPEKLATEEAKEFAINNSHKGFVCEWCGQQSYMLHEHHYPIPRCNGGTDTVHICPNCHSAYHDVCDEEDYDE